MSFIFSISKRQMDRSAVQTYRSVGASRGTNAVVLRSSVRSVASTMAWIFRAATPTPCAASWALKSSAKVEFLTNFERPFIIIYRCFQTPATPPNKWRCSVSLISVSCRRHVQCPRHWFRSKKGCVPL